MTIHPNWWQIAFLLFAAVMVISLASRGWRLGIARMLINLVALGAAYATSIWGRKLLAPLFHPDVVTPMACACILGALVFFGMRAALRRAARRLPVAGRFGSGTAGAIFGAASGMLLTWVVAIAIRLTGTIAENEFAPRPPATREAGKPAAPVQDVRSRPFAHGLADLKRSLDDGKMGAAIQRVDPVPADVYSIIGKIGRVIADAEAIDRFLAYPGAQQLAEHPKMVALSNDAEISDELADGNYLGLLKSDRIVNALNDSQLMELVRKFELEKALDYALNTGAKSAPPPNATD